MFWGLHLFICTPIDSQGTVSTMCTPHLEPDGILCVTYQQRKCANKNTNLLHVTLLL
jgi:hypothetical protein